MQPGQGLVLVVTFGPELRGKSNRTVPGALLEKNRPFQIQVRYAIPHAHSMLSAIIPSTAAT
jgi:hypothetical protein